MSVSCSFDSECVGSSFFSSSSETKCCLGYCNTESYCDTTETVHSAVSLGDSDCDFLEDCCLGTCYGSFASSPCNGNNDISQNVNSAVQLSIGIIIAIVVGSLIFCAGCIGLCVYLCARSSRSRPMATPGRTAVVTTTTTAPVNQGAYAGQPQGYPMHQTNPGGATVYPQTNIGTQPGAYPPAAPNAYPPGAPPYPGANPAGGYPPPATATSYPTGNPPPSAPPSYNDASGAPQYKQPL